LETLKDYDYPLPRELIAQEPPARRSRSRLMVLDRKSGTRAHHFFEGLPRFLRSGDILVLNDTRVIPARIEARRETGGRVELFLLEPAAGGGAWIVLARPSGRLKPLETLRLVKGGRAVLEEFRGGGEWLASFSGVGGREGLFAQGRMPLPRYIRRQEGTDPRDGLDRERYQTVYASRDGAVAAPTAGLHFTDDLLGRIEDAGVLIVRVTLHVGAGTFAPVREEDFRRHSMHSERYSLSPAAAGEINAATAAPTALATPKWGGTRAGRSRASPMREASCGAGPPMTTTETGEILSSRRTSWMV